MIHGFYFVDSMFWKLFISGIVLLISIRLIIILRRAARVAAGRQYKDVITKSTIVILKIKKNHEDIYVDCKYIDTGEEFTITLLRLLTKYREL